MLVLRLCINHFQKILKISKDRVADANEALLDLGFSNVVPLAGGIDT